MIHDSFFSNNAKPGPNALNKAEQQAPAENFVKMQQFQADFLNWLNSSESQQDIDGYYYRTIR